MSVAESRPFALDFFSQVDGANGLGRDAAQSEFVDNAKDADSTFHWTAITSVDPETNSYFMIGLDHGDGLYELPQLFGLGEQTLKKSEGKLGLKNTGHMAAIAAFKPDAVYYYSQASCMSFKIKEFSQAYKAEMSAEGGRDYRKGTLNPTKYMRFNDSPTENDSAVLTKAIASVKTPELSSMLENIRNKLTTKYLLQIMVFSNDRNAALAKELWDATNTFRFYYAKALQNGFQIHLEMPSGDAKHLDGEDTISPLGNAFQRLQFQCEVRRVNKRILMEVTMSTIPVTEVAPQFWVSGTTTADLTLEKPMSWDSGKSLGNFTIQTTCLSQAEQLEQTRKLVPYTVDNLRGVYCEFMDRILGLPYWDGHNYGAAKNAGGVRAVITFEKHAIAEKLLAISSHKHKTNLKESHPVVKDFIKKVVRLVVDNYSYTGLNTAGKGQNPGVATWDVNKCYRQMLGLPEPAVIDDGGEDTSSEGSTDTEDDDDSVPPPPPDDAQPQPAPPAPAPAPPAPAPQPLLPILSFSSTPTDIRLELNDTVITFPHDSKYSLFRDIIRSKYMTLGAEEGLAYIEELAEVQRRYAE